MNKSLLTLLVTIGLVLPALALAASHDHGSTHNKKGHDAHAEMMNDPAMLMLPEQTVEGITAIVHLKDIKATMAKMGMKQTHHFMVTFKNAAGKHVEAQVAAVKIVAPDGKEGEAVELPSMQEHSGADVILAAAGAYTFKVAAKLPGDKKVQYEFKTTLK